jgi:hypothetical protein
VDVAVARGETKPVDVSRCGSRLAGEEVMYRGLLLACTVASPAFAQGIAGVVRDSIDRRPISSAVLTLVDSAGATVARTLTSDRGEYRIVLTGTGRSIRVVRIGFEPRELPIPKKAVGNVQLDFSMLALPTMLRAARITADSRCSARKDRAAALGLWEQTRAGLLATIVAREENPALLHRLLFNRVMDGTSERIDSMGVRADSVDASATSFASAHSAADLVQFGFATDSTSSATYFAPDADVLLSLYFAAGYCFQLADGGRSRPRQVGLHFVPSDERRGRTDIDGVLWVDTAARALRDVEFQYLGMPRPAEAFHPGGRVEFHAMPNGVVMIDRWSIRVVSASEDTTQTLDRQGGFTASIRDRLYAEDQGGELAQAEWRNGATWDASLGAVEIRATTRAGKAATGSVIALVASPYFGVTDATGTAKLQKLVPGPYAVRIVDPRIAELGIGLPTPVKFTAIRDSTVVARLTVPTAEDFIAERCVAAHQWTAGDSVFVLGRVVKPDGTPVANARVEFASGIINGQPQVRPDFYVTGGDGIFQSCRGWHVGDDIEISVRTPNSLSAHVKRTIESNILPVKIVATSP